MDALEFLIWGLVVAGIVVAGSIVALVLVTVATTIRKQLRGEK